MAALASRYSGEGRLLATADVREENLTVSDFNWKAVLKSLPADTTAAVHTLPQRDIADLKEEIAQHKQETARHTEEMAEYKREIEQNKEDATRHALEIAQNKTEIAQHEQHMRALRVEMSELRLAGIGEGGSRKHRAADNASSSQLARVADDN